MKLNQSIETHFYRLFLFANLISIWGGLVYYFYALNSTGVIISIMAAFLSYLFLRKNVRSSEPEADTNDTKNKFFRNKTLIALLYLIFWLASIIILYKSSSDASLISPWQVVPAYFFIFYFLATALLALISIAGYYRVLFSALHLLLTWSVALIVFKVGYGFDPFIHQATLELIDKTGSVNPKPLYYLGQYALIIIIHKITFLPIRWLNLLLVPILASIYLPIFLEQANRKLFNGRFRLWPLALLLIPLPIFILSTPQNLAFFLLLCVAILSMIYPDKNADKQLFVLAIAAAASQPIAGIPALMIAIWRIIGHSKLELKQLGYAGLTAVSAVSLPLLFFWLELKNGQQIQFSPAAIFSFFRNAFFAIPGQENFGLNFIYMYAFSLKTLIAALIVFGVIVYFRKAKTIDLFPNLFLGGAFFISFLVSLTLSYGYLIAYERTNYADRILIAALIILSPFVLIAFYNLYSAISAEKKQFRLLLLFFSITMAAASLYLLYPRFDNYHNSRGYSVGKIDIEAVRQIEEDSRGEPYIVLANQQVSVAALREFGFSRYYKDDIFYYPIPTGAPLYKYYLKMVYEKPSRETMSEAMDLAGVNTGYFVLNKYWWAFPKILDEAKLEANEWRSLGSGEIFLFKFIR